MALEWLSDYVLEDGWDVLLGGEASKSPFPLHALEEPSPHLMVLNETEIHSHRVQGTMCYRPGWQSGMLAGAAHRGPPESWGTENGVSKRKGSEERGPCAPRKESQ